MRTTSAGGTASRAKDAGSSLTDVRCHAPTTSARTSGMGAGARRHAPSTNMHARRNRDRIISHDATIGFMGKFKPVRAKAKKTTRPQGAAGCVVLILAIMVGVMVFLYLVM